MATKIGDIFKIGNDSNGHYLHLVAIDEVNLNSDVVKVYNVDPSSVESKSLRDHELFYTHVSVDEGLKQKLWTKVGNIIPDNKIKDLSFKNFRDSDTVEIETDVEGADPEWAVWKVSDHNWKIINYDKGLKIEAEDGGIAPPADILYRIKHGKSEFYRGYDQ